MFVISTNESNRVAKSRFRETKQGEEKSADQEGDTSRKGERKDRPKAEDEVGCGTPVKLCSISWRIRKRWPSGIFARGF